MRLNYKNKFIFLLIVSVLLAITLIGSFVWQGNLLKKYNQELKNKAEQLRQSQSEIEQIVEAQQQIKNVNIGELDQYLLSSGAIFDFIDTLRALEGKYSLAETNLKLGQPENKQIIVELNLLGDYPNLSSFLQDLNKEKITFSTNKIEFKIAAEDKVALNLEINIPYYVED